MVLVLQLIDLPLVVLIMLRLLRRYPGRDRAVGEGRRRVGLWVFWRVILPLVRPGLVATAFLCTIFSWNNYLFSYLLTSGDHQTAVVRLTLYRTFTGMMWGPMSGAILLTVVPVLLAGDRHSEVYRARPDAGRGQGLAGGGGSGDPSALPRSGRFTIRRVIAVRDL